MKKNIIISNIGTYNSGNYGCSATGVPRHHVEDIQLNHFTIAQMEGLEKGEYLPSMERAVGQSPDVHNLGFGKMY